MEGPSKAEIAFEDRKDGSCGVSYVVQEPGGCPRWGPARLGFCSPTRQEAAGATELLLLLQPRPLPHLPPPHIPRIVCVFPELNPDPGSLSRDEAGVGWFLPCLPRFWGLG